MAEKKKLPLTSTSKHFGIHQTILSGRHQIHSQKFHIWRKYQQERRYKLNLNK